MILKEANFLARKNNRKRHKNLPLLFLFTDRKRIDIFSAINSLPKGAAIILREYDLSYLERLNLAKKIIAIAKEKSLIMLIGKDLKLALEVRAHGVHFSDNEISWINYLRYQRLLRNNLLRKNFIKNNSQKNNSIKNNSQKNNFVNNNFIKNNSRKNFIFTCSCHKIPTLKKAEKSGFDLAFYSPVFKTESHPTQNFLGSLKLAKITRNAKIPVYALGGINGQNIKSLRGCNISGIGGIGLFAEINQEKN
jgi:thiamine monophosphate synthase